MRKEKLVEKIPQEKVKDNDFILNPNISVGDFRFGRNIEEYILGYDFKFFEPFSGLEDDAGNYKNENLGITLYIDNDKSINSIFCKKYCFYDGINLVGLNVDKFIVSFGKKPDKIEKFSVFLNESEIQNQTAYDIDDLGICLWTYRKKILKVTCHNDVE